MIEVTKNNSQGGNSTINYKNFNAILEYHVLNQEKLLNNYEFSVNTGKLLNLIYHIRPGTLDSQILSESKDAIERNLLKLVSQSLNIVNSKKTIFLFTIFVVPWMYCHPSSILRRKTILNLVLKHKKH
ncbi:hypothetical protein CS369_05300 [Candidatus Symbiopectobacterium sp. 'North America']|nr:hypothetical protein [Candidatus Symbiopectobacterium sp. 'North America']